MAYIKKIYYGWYIALSGTITSFISLAVLQIGHGAFINDIICQSLVVINVNE